MNDQRIKVLFITYEYGKNIKGGIARVINGISGQLPAKIDLDIMVNQSPYFEFHLQLLFLKWLSMIQIPWYKVIQFRNQKVKINHHPGFETTLINLIKSEKYDLVHLFHIGDFTETAIRIIRRNFPQLKIVYSCHSIAKYDIAFRNSFTNQLGYEHYMMSNIDHLHLLNQTSLKYLKQSYPQTGRPLTLSIIPNGVDEISFRRKAPRFERKIGQWLKDDGWITVLCMSRWSYGKGLEYLLEAIPQVTSRYPNIRFVLAGRKSRSWENESSAYTKMIDQKINAVKENVVVFGWLKDEQRNTLFERADIWVMPSLLEYFPYSVLEPMAAKIPIISARIDSVQEMLTENRECLFYEPQSSEQLAGQILNLANNPGLRQEIAQNAYQKAKNQYPWETIAEMYVNMYQDLCNGVKGPDF